MVEHVAIPDSQRHEPRGASTAVNNTVLTSNGDGTTSFEFVDWNNLVNRPTISGYTQIMGAFSGSSQNPAALDTPIQVSFGSAQTLTDVSLASNGTVTFNTPGRYLITLFLRFGRIGGAGTSIILNRFLVNNVQGLNSNVCSVDNANITIPFSTTLSMSVNAGDTFKLEIMRDSSGNNSGGLIATIPTLPSWNISPSATIIVSKFIGA